MKNCTFEPQINEKKLDTRNFDNENFYHREHSRIQQTSEFLKMVNFINFI